MQGYCTTDEELAQEQAMLTEDERQELAQLDAKAQPRDQGDVLLMLARAAEYAALRDPEVW